MPLKHLLNGIAIAAACAISGPVWAQANPSGGERTGVSGPNFSAGGNLSPDAGGYSSPAPPAPTATSATPPPHHAVRRAGAMHAHHKYAARKAALTGDTTAQLNRQELARAQTEFQTASQKQLGQSRDDRARKQEQLRNIYDMFRDTSRRP